jgi:hypothetical protein
MLSNNGTFFPASGRRNASGGLENNGTVGNYFTATISSSQSGPEFSGWMTIGGDNLPITYATPIRCVK